MLPFFQQRIFDLMTLNLNMEPTFIVETMALQWVSELTFAENVPDLIKQFKKERGLKSFKVPDCESLNNFFLDCSLFIKISISVNYVLQVVVYGPPIVGKTTLSKLICEAYALLYVSPETVANDIMEDLVCNGLFYFVFKHSIIDKRYFNRLGVYTTGRKVKPLTCPCRLARKKTLEPMLTMSLKMKVSRKPLNKPSLYCSLDGPSAMMKFWGKSLPFYFLFGIQLYICKKMTKC